MRYYKFAGYKVCAISLDDGVEVVLPALVGHDVNRQIGQVPVRVYNDRPRELDIIVSSGPILGWGKLDTDKSCYFVPKIAVDPPLMPLEMVRQFAKSFDIKLHEWLSVEEFEARHEDAAK